MAGRIALPQRFQQLTETAQKPDTSYYRWFESVEVTLRDLDGRVTVLEASAGGGGSPFIMQGLLSVEVIGTPAGGLVQLQLDGDVSAPGNTFYYGTNAAGVKGWYINSSIVPSPDTNRTFWRGDLVWSNELEGPFSARALTDTAVLGADLVTNGTFTGSAAGWTLGAGWAYVADNVILTNPGAGTLSQSIAVVSGTQYLVTWSQQHSVSNSATLTPTIGAAAGIGIAYGNTGANTQAQIIVAAATGSLPLTFTPTAGTSGTVTIDSVSVVSVSQIPFTLELENAAGAGVVEHRAFAISSNLGVGSSAGRSLTTGINNLFFGAAAGLSNTTGSGNAFFSSFAGASNTTGMNNAFLGSNSGRNSTTGNGNVFFGSTAGRMSTTGGNNVYVGFNAGFSATTPNSNVYIGAAAGFNTLTGGSNVGVGDSAFGNNISGVGTVAVGNLAGRFHADGVTALTSATNGVYIGNGARGFNNSDNNCIAVGQGAIGLGANTAKWGNTSITSHYFSGSINLNQTSLADLGAGVLRILNATTVPSVNPVNGVVLYAEAGAAKCRGSSGTVTTFGPAAPHCSTCGSDFVHEWENETRGYGYLAVCMSCYADGVRSFTRTKGQWTE